MSFPVVKHKFLDGKHVFQAEKHKFHVRKHKNIFECETFVVQKRNFCRTDWEKKLVRNKKLVEK